MPSDGFSDGLSAGLSDGRYKLGVSSRLKGYLTNNGDVNFARLGALVGQNGRRVEHHLMASDCLVRPLIASDCV